MDNTLFEFIVEEHNGEQEYSYTRYVWAESLHKAKEFAREWAKGWYEEGCETSPFEYEAELGYNYVSWKVRDFNFVDQIVIDPIGSPKLAFLLKDATTMEY